jgi:ATP-binding cassette subfamily B protein
MVGIVILEICLRIINNYLQNIYGEKMQIYLKEKLYANILKTDVYTLSKYQESDILTRLTSDVKIVSSGVISVIPNAVLSISRIIFAFSVLFILDYAFALILLGAGFIIFFLTMILRRRNKRLQKEIQISEAETLGFYKEGITNLDVLKVFNNQKQISDKQKNISEHYYQSNIKKDNFNLLVNSGFLMVMRFSFLFSIIWCAFRFNQGITIGSLLAIVQLISQITIPFTNLSGILPTYYSCLASIDRIFEIEDLAKEEIKEKVDFEYLQANDISYSYDRDAVIEKSSFKIYKNDFVVVRAGSGRGKTTLIKLIMGLYNPDSGSILVNGKTAVAKVCDLYAYLPQKNLMMTGTIKENLLFFAKSKNDEEIHKALEFACIKDEIDKFPDGINTYLSDYGSGLSEGQLQRLSIARVILADRQVIVLDEATSALNSELEERILNNLKKIEKTIIFISHKDRSLEFSNVILTIENGVVQHG